MGPPEHVRLLRSVGPGMLVTWDRGLHSFDLVVATRARQAHVLGRLPANVTPEVVRTLRDGADAAVPHEAELLDHAAPHPDHAPRVPAHGAR